jgi:hypothetical protein
MQRKTIDSLHRQVAAAKYERIRGEVTPPVNQIPKTVSDPRILKIRDLTNEIAATLGVMREAAAAVATNLIMLDEMKKRPGS